MLDAYSFDVLQVVVMVMMVTVSMIIRGAMIMTLQLSTKINLAEIENTAKIDIRVLGPLDRGDLVQASDLLLCLIQLLGRREIDLVEHDQVGKGDLLARLDRLLEPGRDILGVDQRHHASKR